MADSLDKLKEEHQQVDLADRHEWLIRKKSIIKSQLKDHERDIRNYVAMSESVKSEIPLDLVQFGLVITGERIPEKSLLKQMEWIKLELRRQDVGQSNPRRMEVLGDNMANLRRIYDEMISTGIIRDIDVVTILDHHFRQGKTKIQDSSAYRGSKSKNNTLPQRSRGDNLYNFVLNLVNKHLSTTDIVRLQKSLNNTLAERKATNS